MVVVIVDSFLSLLLVLVVMMMDNCSEEYARINGYGYLCRILFYIHGNDWIKTAASNSTV